MIIDSHAHIFPDKIALKAAKGIGEFYGLEMRYDGSIKSLLESGEKAGIDKFIVHSVATVPEQIRNINNFLASAVEQYPEKLIAFATLHPDMKDMPGEINRIRDMGFNGVKLHPDFQKFNIDSRKAMKIYERIEGQFPLLVHTGDYRYEYSKPSRLVSVLENFPNLDVIAAHFGGWSQWNEAEKALAGKRLFVDTSSSFYSMTPDKAKQLIDAFGADRCLFGTDYPMWDAAQELEMLKKIPISDGQMEKILHGNIEKLLGFDT
ncbi:MAG: amidohydrolase family protein [Oscillospiraceae bacterium]|jgi:predicted TIM-barrel fold metal-dependent hydrolase|nr:amidohydrolase family protein [Oscillospiraceae bacterium]